MARRYTWHTNYAVLYFDMTEHAARIHSGLTAKESRILYNKIVSRHDVINVMRVKTLGNNNYYSIYYPTYHKRMKYEEEA